MEGQLYRFLKMTEVVVTRYQRETGEKLQSNLEELGGKTASLVATLQEQGAQAAQAHDERQAQFSQQVAVLNKVAQEVEILAGSVQMASHAMETSVDKLAHATDDSIDRMNAGAGTLNVAASTLTQGLDGMRTAAAGIAGSSDSEPPHRPTCLRRRTRWKGRWMSTGATRTALPASRKTCER